MDKNTKIEKQLEIDMNNNKDNLKKYFRNALDRKNMANIRDYKQNELRPIIK